MKREIDDIVVSALSRVSLVLNSQTFELDDYTKLRKLDRHKLAKELNGDPNLFLYNILQKDKFLSSDAAFKRYFYNDLKVEKGDGFRKLVFNPTESFLTEFFESYEKPDDSNEDLCVTNKDSEDSKLNFMSTYLVKNLWHNYIHNEVQNINIHTYKDFKGPARVDSEYFADHLANLLLVHSYGYDVFEYTPTQIRRSDFLQMSAVYKRLKCSDMFRKRALLLGEVDAQFEERKLRSLLNYCSTWLICNDLSPIDLTVFKNNKEEFIFRVNRIYINSKVRDEVETSTKKKERNTIFENATKSLSIQYRNILDNDEDKRHIAKCLLGTFLSQVDKAIPTPEVSRLAIA